MSSPSTTSADVEKTAQIYEINSDENTGYDLTQEHYDYLMERHGTIELDPLPSADPNDPLNWPEWKKNYQIFLVALGTFSATFMAAGLTPAFEAMSIEYSVPLASVSYLVASQIAAFGVLPLFWVPLMNTYGRKFFVTLGAFACCVLNIGGAFCTSYELQMLTRILVGIFISTVMASGGAFVADLSFASERGKKNGWWSVALIIGTPGGPFVTGFIQQYAGTKWVYFTFAILNFVQLILWVFSAETVFTRSNPEYKSEGMYKALGIRVSEARPFSWKMFVRPFKQATNFNVTLATIAASITFCYANIVIVVEMPQVMIPLFQLSPQDLALQYISIIIGSIIGEVLGGPLSDWWMKRCIAKRGGKRVIADRLCVCYNGYVWVIVGLIVWGVTLYTAEVGNWTIKPLIGCAITAAGNNIVATVITTFAIDSSPTKAADVALYLNCVRSLFGFLGPLYFHVMFDTLNFVGSAGLMCGLVFVFAFGPTAVAHIMGTRKAK
ncbi:uncharacterized protein J8A68_001416 [[Candida] subhashii]|uniref:Major facilitator superfamily (MFS) profile domain-containing protein n=1 Tax=[Candida] subhashii TaxID=561895 RepID=A0A8J5QUA2_9ASCO|nr:uncharacterized protein J8A68_001416 [[Candida] subhashii]KAG7665107.1 hypothetical protein J8A68_001416 [[Candida] subhashii]